MSKSKNPCYPVGCIHPSPGLACVCVCVDVCVALSFACETCQRRVYSHAWSRDVGLCIGLSVHRLLNSLDPLRSM